MCYLTFGVPHLDSCSIIADTKLLLHICSYFKSEHSIQSQKFVSPYFVKKQPIENVSNKIVNPVTYDENEQLLRTSTVRF